MTPKTDHSFHIGEQHRKTGKPNQDYTLSGVFDSGIAYAIVSDGCSSGGMTDIGSRLMVLATKRALLEFTEDSSVPQSNTDALKINALRDTYLEEYRSALDLEYSDLLATCLWAVAADNGVLVHITGDGFIGLQYEDQLRIQSFQWNANMPYYPAYKLGNMDEQFMSAAADEATPFTYLDEGTASEETGGFLRKLSVEEGMTGMNFFLEHNTFDVYSGKLISIALFSDGAEQVDGLTTNETVTELMAFKSTNGQFAVRRMNRFFRDIQQRSRGPIDDIAYAVIHLDSP